MKCDVCGKEFVCGNKPDGTPNGIGLQYPKGTINVCADCVCTVKKNPLIMQKLQKLAKELQG